MMKKHSTKLGSQMMPFFLSLPRTANLWWSRLRQEETRASNSRWSWRFPTSTTILSTRAGSLTLSSVSATFLCRAWHSPTATPSIWSREPRAKSTGSSPMSVSVQAHCYVYCPPTYRYIVSDTKTLNYVAFFGQISFFPGDLKAISLCSIFQGT